MNYGGNKWFDNHTKDELKKEQRGKLNRRQFLKVGASVSGTGPALGVTTLSGNKGKLFAEVAKATIIKKIEDFFFFLFFYFSLIEDGDQKKCHQTD